MGLFSGGVGGAIIGVVGVGIAASALIPGLQPFAPWLVPAGLSIASIGVGLATRPEVQDPSSGSVERSLEMTDREVPLRWVYGETAVAPIVAWQGIGGPKNRLEGLDLGICRHSIDAVVAVQLGDDYLPIVGSDTGSNIGLVLNSARSGGADTGYPSDWYVPTIASRWDRDNQYDSNDDDDDSHIGFKFYTQDHPASNDTKMAAVFGTDYTHRGGSPIARKWVNWTMAHCIILANTDLGTLNAPPSILFHVRGKDDVYDPRLSGGAGGTGYTKNAVLIAADVGKEMLGLDPATDFTGHDGTLAEEADLADLVGWNGGSETAAFGVINGVIEDDENPHEAIQEIVRTHMAGGIVERGDQIAIRCGYVGQSTTDGSQTPPLAMALDMSDAAGDGVTVPPEEAEWYNTVLPWFVPLTTQTVDGNTVIHGRMTRAAEVTASSYRTEDGDATGRLRSETQFRFCSIGRRAKFLASIGLDQARLGSTRQQEFKPPAILLEPGDRVTLDDADVAGSPVAFQVASNDVDLGQLTAGLAMVRYDDAIYTSDVVVEDDLGYLSRYDRGSVEMPLITSLDVENDDSSPTIVVDGRIKASVRVTWDSIDDVRVTAGGGVDLRWRSQNSVSWRGSMTVPGIQDSTVISDLNDGVNYRIEARSKGANGETGRWVRYGGVSSPDWFFLVQAVYDALPGEVPNVERGDVVGPNQTFKRSRVDTTDTTPANARVYGWRKPGSGDSGGSVNIRKSAYAATGLGRVMVLKTSTTQGHKWSTQWWTGVSESSQGNTNGIDERVDVTPGAFLEVRVRVGLIDAIGAPAGQRAAVRIIYYDKDGTTIERDSSTGPIRFDEYFVGRAGENTTVADVVFPDVGDGYAGITNVIQIPRGGYGIATFALHVEVENQLSSGAAAVAYDYVRPRFVSTFWGKQNRSGSVSGGDPSKAGREDEYRTLVGMAGRGIYNPADGNDFLITLTADVQADASGASNRVVMYVAMLRHLETNGSVDPQTAIGDGYTEWIELDTDNDGTPDEYEVDVAYDDPPGSPVPSYPVPGAWRSIVITWRDASAPALPDHPESPQSSPPKSNRWVYKAMCITDRANGEAHFRNASLRIDQVPRGTGDTTG